MDFDYMQERQWVLEYLDFPSPYWACLFEEFD